MTAIVVALRDDSMAGSAIDLAQRVRSAIDRGSVMGADVVGLGPEGPAFRIEGASMEDVVELAAAFARDEGERFAVGVGYGELAAVREESSLARLSVGPALARAVALARVAAVGEVVVDAALPEAQAGALLSVGKRVATDGSRRLRGWVLDLEEPWRHQSSEAIERLHTPRIVGRELALAATESVERGGIAIVRAAPGLGGSRFLREAAGRAIASLTLAPTGLGAEPLGALRRAFDRVRSAGKLPPLGNAEAETLRLLESNVGIDIATAADLVVATLGAHADDHERPVVLIDDAAHVDRASLEVIAHAAATPDAPFAVAIRIDPSDPLPPALANLVVEADVTLKPLAPHEAATLIEDACGGPAAISADVRKRWVRRGGGIPLALVEALRHGVALGELALRDGVVVPRSKLAGRGRALSPQAWLTRRLAALAVDRPDAATVVNLVALAGPGFARGLLDEIATDLGLPLGEPLDQIVDRLCREGWIEREGSTLSPTTRTLCEAVGARLEEGPRRRLHGAIAAVMSRVFRGTDLAEASAHAALAGDHLGAAALATRAADRATRVGLLQAAEALTVFAKSQGRDGAPLATTPSPPPAARAAARKSPIAEPPPAPDVDGPTTHRSPPPLAKPVPSLGAALSTTEIALLPNPGTPAMPTLITRGASEHGFEVVEELDPDALEDVESIDAGELEKIYQRALASLPPPTAPSSTREGTDPHVLVSDLTDPPESEGRQTLTEAPVGSEARRALLSRDWDALDKAASDLEESLPESTRLRLRSISALGRGDTVASIGFALRARAAARDDRSLARASLACAVALEAAGAREDALLEAFEALSRARAIEPGGIGDRACLHVIDRLLPPAPEG